jgi:predicted nuclease of restriction endonuclease-like (RecB) superfamily
MRAFAEAYSDFLIVQAPLAQLKTVVITQPPVVKLQANAIVQAPLAQLSWFHHITLLDKIKDPGIRLFYINKAVENGWSRNVMVWQIENQLHKRQGKALTNFENTLPKPESDLAREILKNPYLFDFLNLGEEAKERELENALMQHLKKFLLELGRGFAYIGNQFNIDVGGDDFIFDLLFYNTRLHCYVIFELKVGPFEPEFAGKLNFYLSAVDTQIKMPEDKPTIGVLLCKTPNKTVIEYALRGIDKPLGVADFELNKALPKKLKTGMPTIQELEAALEGEVKKLKQPPHKQIKKATAKRKIKPIAVKKKKVLKKKK